MNGYRLVVTNGYPIQVGKFYCPGHIHLTILNAMKAHWKSIRAAISWCLTVHLQTHCAGLIGSSSQLCSDLPNLIMLLHAGMYEGQAPACTFHINNLPLGIWPGSLPQGPCCKLGHLPTEAPVWSSPVLPESLLKFTKYTNKLFSLSWSTGTIFYIAYLHIFQPLF